MDLPRSARARHAAASLRKSLLHGWKRPLIALGLAVSFAAGLVAQGYRPASWIESGISEMLPILGEYGDSLGTLGTLVPTGGALTDGNPFFQPLGTNGRSCVTCHQPGWGMSVSDEIIRDRWELTDGTDFIFAAFDGSNCPSLPQRDIQSHSLLLKHGLFRIPISWPPTNADGSAKPVEFTLEVVHDPTGCNRSARYGINGTNHTVNVYRRPRPSANLKYVIAGGTRVNAKTGEPAAIDPTTGEPSAMNLMTDAREASLTTQALSAIMGHEESHVQPSADTLRRIVEFESQVYTAQVHVFGAGRFDRPGVPAALGPQALREGHAGLAADAKMPVFGLFDMWKSPKNASPYDPYSPSIARGAELFARREFTIKDTAYVNGADSAPVKGTCGTCHKARMTGQALNAGWIDVGTTNISESAAKTANFQASELPVFKVTCRADAKPHPFLGRVIYTTDPGRALISGKCADVGSIVMQQLRALSARAPYFANGTAATLRDVVDFHDKRYQMHLTNAEKDDIANFLGAL